MNNPTQNMGANRNLAGTTSDDSVASRKLASSPLPALIRQPSGHLGPKTTLNRFRKSIYLSCLFIHIIALGLFTTEIKAQTTYYMSGLLRQPDDVTARQYLKITNGSGGSGGVTNFSAGNLPPLFTTSVSSPTQNPTLSFLLNNQSANLVFAGPSSGGAAAPTFRSLVSGDIPDLSSLYLISITNASHGLLGVSMISSSNPPIAAIKSISAGAGVSVTDQGGTNIQIDAPGNIAGVDIPMTFTSPYANNTNFNIDFTFAAQTLNTPTNLIVFNYATNWGLSATSRLANIFIQWTNFGRLFYFVNQATNWNVQPQIWYLPPGYGAHLEAQAFGVLDTNITLRTYIDSYPVGSNTTVSFNPTNAFPTNVTFGTRLWLDASRLVFQDEFTNTPAQDGSQVRGWNDLAHFTTTLTNNTSAGMTLTYHTPASGPFNVPCVQALPGVTWLQSPTFASQTQPMWAFIMFYNRGGGSVLDFATSGRFACNPVQCGQSGSLFTGSPGVTYTGPRSMTWCLFAFFASSTGGTIRTNGVQAASGTMSTSSGTSWNFGSDSSHTTGVSTYQVAECLVINSNLTATQITNVESYFWRKYPFFTPPTIQ